MEDTRLPKCAMFGEFVGGTDCVGGQEKEWMGCFLDDLRASPTSGQLQTKTRRISEWIAYIELGENHGTTLILDGVSYSAYTVL